MKIFVRNCFIVNMLFFLTASNFNENRYLNMAENEPEEVLTFPNLVTIKTADFLFLEVPDTIPSGMNTFRIENQGAYPHNADREANVANR